MNNNNRPNIVRMIARPCAPPCGIAMKYTIEKTIHAKPCKAYFNVSHIFPFFPSSPITKKTAVG